MTKLQAEISKTISDMTTAELADLANQLALELSMRSTNTDYDQTERKYLFAACDYAREASLRIIKVVLKRQGRRS